MGSICLRGISLDNSFCSSTVKFDLYIFPCFNNSLATFFEATSIKALFVNAVIKTDFPSEHNLVHSSAISCVFPVPGGPYKIVTSDEFIWL